MFSPLVKKCTYTQRVFLSPYHPPYFGCVLALAPETVQSVRPLSLARILWQQRKKP